jgi:hypothetical protein
MTIGYSSDIYTGTAEQIVATGLIHRDQLPGRPGRMSTVARYAPSGRPIGRKSALQFAAGAIEITRHRNRYVMHVEVSEDERERRAKKWAAEQKRADELARARASAESVCSSQLMPTTEADYRGFVAMMGDLVNMADGRSFGGFRYDDASRRRIAAAIAEHRAALAEGAVIFDATDRQREVDRYYKEVRRLEAEPAPGVMASAR